MRLPKALAVDILSRAAVGPAVRLPEEGPYTDAELNSTVTLRLPWPPSVNHYWRHAGPKVLVSVKGREYRRAVTGWVNEARFAGQARHMKGRLSVFVAAHPPDRRKRDLDNLMKAVLDSLQHAGLYESDEQIDRLMIHRSDPRPGGELVVIVRELEKENPP